MTSATGGGMDTKAAGADLENLLDAIDELTEAVRQRCLAAKALRGAEKLVRELLQEVHEMELRLDTKPEAQASDAQHATAPSPRTRGVVAAPCHPEDLRRRRKKLGWTQGQLAARVQVSGPTICNIERGKQHPSADLLASIQRALGLKAAP